MNRSLSLQISISTTDTKSLSRNGWKCQYIMLPKWIQHHKSWYIKQQWSVLNIALSTPPFPISWAVTHLSTLNTGWYGPILQTIFWSHFSLVNLISISKKCFKGISSWGSKSSLVQVTDSHRIGEKPLPEPMMAVAYMGHKDILWL